MLSRLAFRTWDLLQSADVTAGRHGVFNSPVSELSSLRNGAVSNRLSTYQITRHTYRNEGMGAFFRGLGICSARAFVVNAVQWAVSAISSPQVNENTKQEIGIRNG